MAELVYKTGGEFLPLGTGLNLRAGRRLPSWDRVDLPCWSTPCRSDLVFPGHQLFPIRHRHARDLLECCLARSRAAQIIDDDLGRSGGGINRPGFERLLAAICEGRVGAVFAIEASRLARNGRDWHTLIEFCGLVGTI
ncbi:MAG TPA: recombinase family protein [Stellaceae bacterium]|nr:recombinase family protein [Stellaceae bacterium]